MDGEPAQINPCWAIKKCDKTKCVAHGRHVCCWSTPNAGYAKRYCDGPMCVRLKNMVCPSCPVSAQWNLAGLLGTYTEADIQQAIKDGKITTFRNGESDAE